MIFAYFKDENVADTEHELRPAEIQFFFRHDVNLVDSDGEMTTATFGGL